MNQVIFEILSNIFLGIMWFAIGYLWGSHKKGDKK